MTPKTFAYLAGSSLLLLSHVAAAEAAPTSSPPAADTDVCSESYEKAQEQMRPNQAESKLLLARESLRTCLRSSCKSWMVSDCSKWLSEVETRIPTVVFVAKDAAGRDLTGVRVTKPDGTAIVASVDGRSIEMEPGPHDFVFASADGTKVERHAVIREGEKAQAVTATFGTAAGPNPIEPPPNVGPATREETPTLRYVGYGATGLGVVGLGLGAVFGLVTLSKKNSDCTNGLCEPGTRDSLSSTAAVSTVAFVAGGILAAGGLTLVFLSPSSTRRIGARVSAGGLTIGGQW